MKTLAIECEYGSGGYEIGKAVAEKVNVPFYEGASLFKEAEKYGIPINLLNHYGKEEADEILHDFAVIQMQNPGDAVLISQKDLEGIRQTIQILNYRGAGVFYGHCAGKIIEDNKDKLNVFLYSSDRQDRVRRIKRQKGIVECEIEELLERKDFKRENYYTLFSSEKWRDGHNYDIQLNTSKLSIEHCIRILAEEMQADR